MERRILWPYGQVVWVSLSAELVSVTATAIPHTSPGTESKPP
ncbi:MAG: hypothetical protein ABSF03_10665 [Streptosporangiaceae bacterium]